MLFADFPNSKFCFTELFSGYTWHATKNGGWSWIEITLLQISLNFKRIFTVCCLSSFSHLKANIAFKRSVFTLSPSQVLLDLAKKSDLLDIADHYELPNVKNTMLKHEIKNILIQFFVDEEIFDS